jgi:DNA-binding NarL/FixJ family response regulator
MCSTNRILIVDDHAVFRGALRAFLSQEPDFRIVGEAGNLRDAIQSISALSPHLVLTDLAMPDTHGIEAVTAIKRRHPDVKILVISSHSETEYKLRCRQAGAIGYIVKGAMEGDLCDSIRSALGGTTVIGADAPCDASQNYSFDRSPSDDCPGEFLH